MSDLDLSAYDADVVEHALFGLCRARMLDDRFHGMRWNVDLAAGQLVVGDEMHRIAVVGTYAHASKTFLWAWENPQAVGWGRSLEGTMALRSRGKIPGQSVYSESNVSADWVDARELAHVAGEVSGGHPVYSADTGSAIAYLLVTDVRLNPQEISIAYLPGVLLDFASFAKVEQRPCAERLLVRLGFTLEQRKEKSIVATRARDSSHLVVEFAPEGRITHVNFAGGPSAPTGKSKLGKLAALFSRSR